MGEAILRGLVGDVLDSGQVWVSDIVQEKVDSLCEELRGQQSGGASLIL